MKQSNEVCRAGWLVGDAACKTKTNQMRGAAAADVTQNDFKRRGGWCKNTTGITFAPERGGRPLWASAKSRRAQTRSQKLH